MGTTITNLLEDIYLRFISIVENCEHVVTQGRWHMYRQHRAYLYTTQAVTLTTTLLEDIYLYSISIVEHTVNMLSHLVAKCQRYMYMYPRHWANYILIYEAGTQITNLLEDIYLYSISIVEHIMSMLSHLVAQCQRYMYPRHWANYILIYTTEAGTPITNLLEDI